MDLNEIGQIIKKRRRYLKVDQSTLAELAGISINTLVTLERGTSNPRLDTILKIADILGLQISMSLKQ